MNGNNQISSSGPSYDADGDITGDALYSYTYNGAGEITRANGVNYTYDGDGLRVEKSSGTLYWRAYTGQVIEETNTSGGMERDYIFFAGRRIAWKDSSGNVYYYFADAIGSTRAVTDSSGNVCSSADYYPYGQENDYNTSCSPTYKFTGYEFDSETGNYYAYARYYNPRLGRFMSPDFTLADVGSPQSLNGYSYIANNPTSFVGPREMPAAFGAPAGNSTEVFVAALIAGGPTVSIAGGWTGAAPTPVPAHPLGAMLQIAEAAEIEARAFLAYLRSHAPTPTSPYGSAFGAVCDAFSAPGPGPLTQQAWTHPGPSGCGTYLSSPPVPPKNLTPAEQESWFYLNYYQPSFDAIFGAPSASGSNVAEGLSFYTHAYGFPAEDDIPIGGNLLGDWLDAGFPQFDMQMFFGSSGGGGNSCLPTPWDMDPCSF